MAGAGRPGPNLDSLVGKRFGTWLVLRIAERRKGRRAHYYYLCRCDCGTEQVRAAVRAAEERRVAREDRRKERAANAAERASSRLVARLANEVRRSTWAIQRSHKLTYATWHEMVRRCTKPRSKDYPNYGGRGISVCERWRDFAAFLADMGERPSSAHSIDRFPNNDGNYEPGNCRWATATQQNRNSRHTVLTLDLAQEILGRIEHGESRVSVARRMRISEPLVRTVANRRAWRDLAPLGA